jgi:hypothetical protein
MKCPADSHYVFSGSACQPTCEEMRAHESCEQVDTEVCVCNNNMLLKDGVCVPAAQCGCKDANNVRRQVCIRTRRARTAWLVGWLVVWGNSFESSILVFLNQTSRH